MSSAQPNIPHWEFIIPPPKKNKKRSARETAEKLAVKPRLQSAKLPPEKIESIFRARGSITVDEARDQFEVHWREAVHKEFLSTLTCICRYQANSER